MNINITLTEQEFDAFRTWKTLTSPEEWEAYLKWRGLDPVALHRTVIERLAELLTDNASVQGIFNVRDASKDLKSAAMDIRHAVDLAFSEHKIKI